MPPSLALRGPSMGWGFRSASWADDKILKTPYFDSMAQRSNRHFFYALAFSNSGTFYSLNVSLNVEKLPSWSRTESGTEIVPSCEKRQNAFFSPYKSRKWHENSTVCLSNRPFLDSSFPFRVPSGIVPSRHCAHHSRHSNPRKCVLGVNEPLNVEFS